MIEGGRGEWELNDDFNAVDADAATDVAICNAAAYVSAADLDADGSNEEAC